MAIVLFSLGFLGLAAWFRGGVANTPADTMDSQGRTTGFNDVFSGEHYGIIAGKAGWWAAMEQMHPHDWFLVAAHLVMLALIFKTQWHWIRPLCVLQAVLFFWGWIGLYFVPMQLWDFFVGHTQDREGFVDVPFICLMSQGVWLMVCFYMFGNIRKRSVDRRKIGANDPRTGVRRFFLRTLKTIQFGLRSLSPLPRSISNTEERSLGADEKASA